MVMNIKKKIKNMNDGLGGKFKIQSVKKWI